jgi:hypothetical protein
MNNNLWVITITVLRVSMLIINAEAKISGEVSFRTVGSGESSQKGAKVTN